MKLLLLALVAIASAEPDSDSLWLNRFGYHYPTTTAYSGASVYNPLYPRTTYAGLYQYPVNHYNTFVKRDADADAEAEAEPNHHLVYNQQYPFYSQPWGYRTAATVAGEPVLKQGTYHTNLRNVAGYSGYGQVYQPLYNTYVKREAESDSDSYYPFASTYGLNYNYHNYPTTSLYTNSFYNNYQYPRTVYSPFVKREAEAEAEADSDSFYHGYPYASTVYPSARSTFYPSVRSTVYPYASSGYPYTTGVHNRYVNGLYY